jgi:sugar fermentation stimulation protein A
MQGAILKIHGASSTGQLETPGPEALLPFPAGCRTARFCRREKRFLVEVELDGERIWVHCNNSGSMLGLLRKGCEIFLSPALTPGRRLGFTLEMVKWNGFWIGVNTLTPTRLLRKAWERSLLQETAGYTFMRRVAAVCSSRLDACFDGPRG